jgi:uncharacterized DUF497 family protein
VGVRFEWDPAKAEANIRKHGVSFEEAMTVFSDWLSVTVPDSIEPQERLITIGGSHDRTTLVVVHLDFDETIRIISARKATSRERRIYEEGE